MKAMDTPEFFGEDTEEELLAALAKVTYHLRRHRDESCRQFFTRWDDAVRKIEEHRVQLPDKYLGFLLVNALQMSDADIKAMLAFGRGSVAVQDVKNWCRKHEMKLQARDVGNDKRSTGGSGSGRGSTTHYLPEQNDFDEEELYAMEELLREAGPGDDRSTEIAEYDTLDNDEILEEHEAKEVLSTMIAQKKKTFLQSLQTKRAKTLARGYGQWRDKGKDKGSGKGSMSTSGYVKGGYYKMTLSEAKAKSRCSKCKQVGHWHRDPECPHNQPGFHNKTKEVNYMVENQQSEEAIFCGVLDCEKIDGPSTTEAPTVEQAADFECFPDQLRQDQLSPGGSAVSANGDGSDSISVVYKDPLQTGVGCASLGVEGFRGDEYPVLWNETVGKKPRIGYTPNEDLCATIDTGCQRMAIGLNTLRRLDQALPPGLQATIVPQEQRFRSVHGTSTTKYVAAVPTSLGQRGSLLRPAIFETNASRDAPFLISLPFLMFCQAVLYLDPSTGLKVEFRKFHFTAPCHIGPTGSLRVSLANFSPTHIRKLQNAQEEFNSQAKEFEVFRLSSAFGPESYQSEPNCRSEVPSVSHGVARCHQEIPVGDTVRSSGGRTSMEADGAEASVHDLPDHGLGASAAHAKGEGEDASLLGMAAERDSRGSRTKRHGESGKLLNGEVGEIRSGGTHNNSTITDTELCIPGDRGMEPCDTGGDRADGDTTMLHPSSPMHPVHDQKTGSQLRQDVLALSSSSSTTMPLLRMDSGATELEGTSRELGQLSGKPCDTYITEDSSPQDAGPQREGQADREECHPGELHSPADYTGGDQCLCAEGEVRCVWQSPSERTQERFRDGVSPVISDQQVEGREEEDQGLSGRGHIEGRDGRVRGVPEVPTVATAQEGVGLERQQHQDRDRAVNDPPMGECVLEGTTELTKQAERALHQAEAALRTAENSWKELMSLVCTEPDQVETAGWNRFQKEVFDPKDPRKVRNSKALYKFASVLGTDKDQAKTVAEVFNPNRFGPRTKRHGLIQGESFDLELGMDLLKVENQNLVLEYVECVQPGLTIISPPCTLFTILQNLNHARRTEEGMKTYLQRLRWAKVLLRFATKVAKLVMSYGGKFLFEHPLTSKAWQEKFVNDLMMDDQVHLVVADQCMYGLVSRAQVPQRKPTGFITNAEEIAKELGKRCDGSHQHEPVLGSDQGGLRSKQTQIYPEKLVDAILRGYRKEMKLNGTEKIYWTQLDELQQGEKCHQGRQSNLRCEMEELLVEYAVHALGEEDGVVQQDGQAGEPAAEESDDLDGEEEEVGRRRLPRERPFTLQQLVRRAHEGLGHPSNDRLARILRNAKASTEAIKLAKELKCSVCEKHQKVRPPRNAAPPKMLQVNETVGVDTIYLPYPDGRTRMALNIVDWASRFQMVVPLTRHTPGAARQAYLQWTKLFGPPEKLYSDLGKEFQGAFEIGAEMDSTYIEPGALEMPTQRSITERAGKTYKEVFSRACVHYECNDHEEWLQLVVIANMTCNRLLNKPGYSPIQRVLGYSPRIPGGLVSGGGQDLATMSHSGGDVQIQRAQQMRLAAAKAFHEADCSQALKNALHAGPRPPREFEPGQLVYFWRKGTDRPKKDSYIYWKGRVEWCLQHHRTRSGSTTRAM